ncbi:MAG: nat [Rhodocyclales bacterium]|nr:nat [Rhodocyclales bacterium]
MTDDDLGAYFARIGYTGDGKPTLATLAALHVLHPQAIPFENLDSLRQLSVSLDPQVVYDKLLRAQRGGYCYEQNGLFKRVLERLGFEVKGLLARVLWFAPEGTITPRSHMILRVEIDGRSYIADIGFGSFTLTAPLLLDSTGEQATPHEIFRLTPLGNDICIQAKMRGEWRSLYRFELTEQAAVDYESPNWYACTHPSSRFVNNLICARTVPDKRYTLLNNQLSTHSLSEGTSKQILHTAEALRASLRDVFGIAVPQDEAMTAALEKIVLREPPA